MVEIQITAYQCDFCGIRALSMPACIVCGKHMCVKHRIAVDFGIFEYREKSEKLSSVYKESEYVCIECSKDKKALYIKLAGDLIAKSEEEEIPPEEVLK